MSRWRFLIVAVYPNGVNKRINKVYKNFFEARAKRRELAKQFPSNRYLMKMIKADRDEK